MSPTRTPKMKHSRSRRHPVALDPRDQEKAKLRAERERIDGIDQTDAASQWLNKSSGWRNQPVSEAQTKLLTKLNVDLRKIRNKGHASDVLDKILKGKKRGRRRQGRGRRAR